MKLGMLLRSLQVRDVMTQAVMFLNASHSLDEAWAAFHQHSVSGAPVIGEKGRLVGVITTSDLADPRRRPPPGGGRVEDLMTRVVYAVRSDDPVISAVRLMIDEDIHRAVVVNQDGTIAGIVSPMDVLRALARGEDTRERPEGENPIHYVDLREIE